MTEVIEVAREMGWETGYDVLGVDYIEHPGNARYYEWDSTEAHKLLMLAICEKMGWDIGYLDNGEGRFRMDSSAWGGFMPKADLPLAIIHAYYCTVCHKED